MNILSQTHTIPIFFQITPTFPMTHASVGHNDVIIDPNVETPNSLDQGSLNTTTSLLTIWVQN